MEDVTSQLVNQTGDGGILTHVTLPGITIKNGTVKFTLWLSTVFGDGNATRGSRGQDVDRTNEIFSLKNPDSNLEDLAHIYLVYQDPCLTEGQPVDQVSLAGKEAFRGFKSTFKLCLQTLNTTHNASTKTTVLQSHTNLQWSRVQEKDGLLDVDYWKTSLTIEDQTDSFLFPVQSAEIIGGQVATSLNFSASLRDGAGGGDNYIYGSVLASNFISDVLGNDPVTCQKDDGLGMKGFQRRIETLATGLTNA